MKGGLVLGAAMAAILSATGAAQAEDPFPSDFLEGVYSSEPGCASGYEPMRDGAITYLTADGLSAIEYLCEFLRYDGVSGGRGFVAITACSAPGEMTPELILVRALSPADGPAEQVEVLYHGEVEPTVFHHCPAK